MLKAFILMNFRNKILLLMNLLLPIIFFLMFGALWGSESGSLKIAYYSDREIEYPGEKISAEKFENAEELLKKYNLVFYAQNSKIDVYFRTEFSSLDGEIQKFLGTYQKASGEKSVVNIEPNPVYTGVELKPLEYLMIGIIALSLFSVGMNAGIYLYDRYARYGLFKKLQTTPVSSFRIIVSASLSQVITGFISSLIVLLIAKLFYKMTLTPNVPLYILATLASVSLSFSLGLILVVLFKKGAQMAGQIFYTIIMFFSGIYFPITFLPKSLRIVSYFTPTRYSHLIFQRAFGVNSIGNIELFAIIFFSLLIGIFVTLMLGNRIVNREQR